MSNSPKEKKMATLVYDPDVYEEVDLDAEEASRKAEDKGTKRRKIVRVLLWIFGSLLTLALLAAGGCFFVVKRAIRDGGYSESWVEKVNGTTLSDEPYGDKPWEVMDVYLPAQVEPEKSQCAILFIHGGAWIGGARFEQEAFAKRAAKAGYLVANMEYMLYNDDLKEEKNSYSIQKVLDEIDMALAKLKKIGEEHGFDVQRVGLSGHSAGGHLSMLYAYTYKTRENGNPPVEVAFVAPRVGPSEFSAKSWRAEKKPDTIAWFVSFMSGVKVTGEQLVHPDAETQKAIDSISPSHYIKPGVPPTLAAYGAKDSLVPAPQCQITKRAFAKIYAHSFGEVPPGDKSTPVFDLILFPNSNHMLARDPDCTLKWQGLFLAYAERFLQLPEVVEPTPDAGLNDLRNLAPGVDDGDDEEPEETL